MWCKMTTWKVSAQPKHLEDKTWITHLNFQFLFMDTMKEYHRQLIATTYIIEPDGLPPTLYQEWHSVYVLLMGITINRYVANFSL